MWDISKLYKHVNNTDVAIQVLDSKYVDHEGEWKLLVMWYNVGESHKPWCMGITQDIRVSNERQSEWEEYVIK